jgi:putative sigma-54 modulation protein
MQIMVTFRRVEPTEGLRQYAEEKMRRVHKYLRRPIDAHVILSVLKHRHIAEVQVSANHLNITATEETDDLYSAIDLAMSKLERQIKKRVAKVKDHKGADATAAASAAPANGPGGSLIRTERVALKPMSVEEAVLHLRMRKNDFLLFQNAATETVNVIYRRKDGSYGLIEPEPS